VAERIEKGELKIARAMQMELERTADLTAYFEKNREFHYYLGPHPVLTGQVA
jgi:hypothetical protein